MDPGSKQRRDLGFSHQKYEQFAYALDVYKTQKLFSSPWAVPLCVSHQPPFVNT